MPLPSAAISSGVNVRIWPAGSWADASVTNRDAASSIAAVVGFNIGLLLQCAWGPTPTRSFDNPSIGNVNRQCQSTIRRSAICNRQSAIPSVLHRNAERVNLVVIRDDIH